MSEQNVELVRKLFDAMGRGDVEAALRFVRSPLFSLLRRTSLNWAFMP